MKDKEFVEKWTKSINKAVGNEEIDPKHKALYMFLGSFVRLGSAKNPRITLPACRRLSGLTNKNEKEETETWYNHLVRGGYVKNKKLVVEEEFFDDVGLHLMACVALGFLERTSKKREVSYSEPITQKSEDRSVLVKRAHPKKI